MTTPYSQVNDTYLTTEQDYQSFPLGRERLIGFEDEEANERLLAKQRKEPKYAIPHSMPASDLMTVGEVTRAFYVAESRERKLELLDRLSIIQKFGMN